MVSSETRKKILVVDDSPVVRKLIVKLLEEKGYKTVEARDGVEAIDILENTEEISLVTLDVEMPRLDGFETCGRMRAFNQKIPIIFITVKDTLEDRYRGYELGAAYFINKNFLRDELLPAVKRILSPNEYMKGLKALVVLNDGLHRELIGGLLSGEGVEVFSCEDGKTAIDSFKKVTEYDMVISSLSLEKVDGLQLCREVRSTLGYKELPFMFVISEAEKRHTLDIFKAGGTGYLCEPFPVEELLARLSVHLEVRMLNKQLQNSVNELKKLNKLKDRFLSVCSHDLRSPLTGILGFAELLEVKKYQDEDVPEMLLSIRKSGEYLLNLINDLLDLSKAQSERAKLELAPVNVLEVAKECERMLVHLAEAKGVELYVEGEIDSWIKGNFSAMQRIFNNLLSNAVKFTDKDGEVRVKVSADEYKVCVTVKDNGIGISQEDLPKLFDEFTKTSQLGTQGEKGTGLGLAITKKLIEQLGGEILVNSTFGKGTVFKIYFPLNMSSEGTLLIDEEDSIDREIEEVSGLKVLVAEDNVINSRLIKRLLEKRNHDVDLVGSGAEALEIYIESLQGKRRKYDLIIMDTLMPNMDGVEATRAIRHYEKKSGMKKIPILSMSAFDDKENEMRCVEAGMSGFIKKPISMESIDREISKVKKALYMEE